MSRSITKLFIPDWEVTCDPNESFPTYIFAEQRYGIISVIFLLYKERQLFLVTLAIILSDNILSFGPQRIKK